MQAVRFLVFRPHLWPEAVRVAIATSPPGWWRRFPFVPQPHAAYVRWRVATAYGDPQAEPDGSDLVEFLRWRARQRRS